MALILDSSKNTSYVDECGTSFDNPYLIIDSVTINKFKDNYLGIYPSSFLVFIFKDKNSRINGLKPIFEKRFYLDPNRYPDDKTVFDTYFEVSNMQNINIFARSYNYVNTLFPDWKSDEIL
jgi:hypothetical protein